MIFNFIQNQIETKMLKHIAALSFLAGSMAGSAAIAQDRLKPHLIRHGDSEFKVVQSSHVRTAADPSNVRTVGSLFEDEKDSNIALTGCHSCGTHCGGACSTGACGTGACGGGAYGGYSAADMGAYGMSCGVPCEPYTYVIAEALYMDHDGSAPRLSRVFQLNELDYEWGTRLTLGSLPDCVHGTEITYTGRFDWEEERVVSGTNLGTFLTLGSEFVPGSLSAFDEGSVTQGQYYEAEYWSIESNRTVVGWDFAKVLLGFRYINYDELFSYTSRNAAITGSANPADDRAAQNGSLVSDVRNDLYGLQLGLDLLYPTSCHGYMDVRARAGAYLNFADSTVLVVNDGSTLVANSDDADEIAGVFEVGTAYRYDFGECLSVRAGFEMWYLAGVATAPGQVSPLVSSAMGRSIDADDDVFITGFTVGGQLKF